MLGPMIARRLIVVIALALAAGSPRAVAQQTEYQLDASGAWRQTAAPEPGTDEAVMAEARELIAAGRAGRARSLLNGWIERNKRTDNPWLAEAYVLRGDARTADGDEYKALRDYEEVIKRYPGTDQFVRAVERELDIAVRYVNGMRRKLYGVRMAGASSIGEELLIRVQERLPGSRLAERAGIELADYYYRNRKLKLAGIAYELFLQNFPNSQYRKRAQERRIYANVARFKSPKHDGSGLLEAQILIRDFARRYPADAEKAGISDALAARLDESAAAKMLDLAGWYLRRGDAVSARFTLRRLLAKHPRTVAAERAMAFMLEQGWALSEGAPAGAAEAPAADPASEPAEAEEPPVAETEPEGDAGEDRP